MNNLKHESREHKRFETEQQISFYFDYEFQTPLEFRGEPVQPEQSESVKHSGISKNVSAEGLCFTSPMRLNQGMPLQMDVYLLDEKKVHLEGEVRWSRLISSEKDEEPNFETGVKLTVVEGHSIKDTIYYDEAYNVIWSAALESIIGNFRVLAQQKKKPS